MRTNRTIVNVSSVPTPSPFRYPGGKSWLIPYIRQWVESFERPLYFCEPFAGGANVGLALALEDLVTRVTLVELDRDVASVWKTILIDDDSEALGSRIARFNMSKRAVLRLLRTRPRTDLARAFLTIVKNRVRRGGILSGTASLLKLGENGNGLHSRWYPETLRERIKAISSVGAKIRFLQEDGVAFIKKHKRNNKFVFFIDPPYTVAGQRLYREYDLDHRKLFEVASDVSGAVLMTYDNSHEVRCLAQEFGFQFKRVKMRTSHHSVKTELLIGRDFSWLNRRKLRNAETHPS